MTSRAATHLSGSLVENRPELWLDHFPWPGGDTHKYARGHLAVFSGPASMTGAARLSARGGARIGAGAVTVLSPPNALLVNAIHLTAIMVRSLADANALDAFQEKARCRAYVLGPGFGNLEKANAFAITVLAFKQASSLVLDADGITAFRDKPEILFEAIKSSASHVVTTPHEGEFSRLFPDLGEDEGLTRVDRAREAARRSGAVVILKGEETIIADPDGRAAINRNATPFLATAGSGDVLAGFCGGLLAQGMPPFEAASAAVWLHAETASRFGPGLIAEDLPDALPAVLTELGPKALKPKRR
ncbi:NAD(P)H-hydrate dehydratase [Mesorhizobium liriopis]|uniref:NAD(P)H-hydrate dehydratase n=1 Tax=Mesorhizobium liriopis TaxID=2953882 RepID=UPI0033905BB1